MAIFFNIDLGIPIYEVGIIFTLLSVVSIVVSILGGGLADKIGRKNTIIIGSLLGFALYLSLSLMLILKVPIIFVIVVFIISATSGAHDLKIEGVRRALVLPCRVNQWSY